MTILIKKQNHDSVEKGTIIIKVRIHYWQKEAHHDDYKY